MERTRTTLGQLASFVLAGLWAIAVGGTAVCEAQSSGASVEVRWHGGEVLSGNLLTMSESAVSLESRVFAEPIELERSVLDSIRFLWPVQAPLKVEPRYELVLKDGSQLHTDVEKIGDSIVWLVDPRFGRIQITTDQCQSLRELGDVQYEWAGDISKWQRADIDVAASAASWFVDERGALATKTENAKLWFPLALEESFVLSIGFTGKDKPDFMVSTGNDPESALRFGTIGDSLIVGTADDFEVAGEVGKGPQSLQIRWDAGMRELSLLTAEGKPIASTREKKDSVKSGILLHNQGQRLAIGSLRISRSKSSNGKDAEVLRLEPTQVSQISKPDLQRTQIRWKDGSILVCEKATIANGLLQVFRQADQPALECALGSIERIVLGGVPNRAPPLSILSVGAYRVAGQLSFGNVDSPIMWQSVGQKKPVALTSKLPLEVSVGNKSKPAELSLGFRDVLYLANGDVVPCTLNSMTDTTTTVSTPVGGAVAIPNVALSGIELNVNGAKLKHAFTKESRDMMLTIPRSTETSLTTHVLMGSNGDLLRGSVIAMSDKAIEMDSKQEPMVIERDNVAAIGFLAPPKKLEPETVLEKVDEEPEDIPELAMKLRGGYRMMAKFVAQRDGQIECESEWLGKCLVPIEMIEAIAMLKPSFGEELSPFSVWGTQLAKAPRWSQGTQPVPAPDSMLGKKVAEFQLSALDGSTFKLSEHAGRVVVLDFWATWCGPCVASLPEYLEAMGEFAATDAVFLGVNSTETPEVVRAFRDRKGLTGFNSLFDFDQSLMNSMGVAGIPHTVVIGPSGEVAHVHVGYTVGAAKELARIVRDVLKK
jgi:peroxiredoxin